MNSFKDFLDAIPKLTHLPLPGTTSQLKMAAIDRLEDLQRLNLQNKTPKTAAVMMLLYPIDGVTHFVLIERAIDDSKHSGQIAFPGGRMDPEDNGFAQATAVRETWEEIGVAHERQHVIRAGTSIYIPPSNYEVYPYLAFAKAKPQFKLQVSEVRSIIEVPLARLLERTSITQQAITTSYMNDVTVPCFLLNGRVVWGATAMILSEFRDLLLHKSLT